MHKSFLLCPNKRRDLEMFMREELNDKRRVKESRTETSPTLRQISPSQDASSSPAINPSDYFRHLEKPINNVTALGMSGGVTQMLEEPQIARFSSSRSSPPRILSQIPRRLSSSAVTLPSDEARYLSRQNSHFELFSRSTPAASTFIDSFPSHKAGVVYPPQMALKHPAMALHERRRTSSTEHSVEGREISFQDKDSRPKSGLFTDDHLGHFIRQHPPNSSSVTIQAPPPPSFFYPPTENYHRPSPNPVSPIVVDSSIPFTTYLQNLTKTLRESAAKITELEPEDNKAKIKVEQEPGQSEPDSSSTEDVKDAEESDTNGEAPSRSPPRKRKYKELEVGENDDGGRSTTDSQDRRLSSDLVKREAVGRLALKQIIERKTLPSLIIPTIDHSLRELQGGQPTSAPVFPTEPLSASPPSNSSLQLQHHYHQQQQRHIHHPSLKIPGSVLHFPPPPPPPQHHHLQQQHRQHPAAAPPPMQYSGSAFYNKIFSSQLTPPAGPPLTPPHGPQMTTSGAVSSVGLSPLAGGIGGLFHPAFLSLGGLGMRRTSVEKPPPVKKYKCDVCQKAFSRSNTLVTHRRIHTGDKPFKCEVCGRAFRQPGNLTRHRLTHTTHKPYVCHVCSKAFNRASNLNTHIRTHSTFRQFSCSVCPKSFHHKSDLATHVFSHTGERPYKCDVCGRSFSHANTLAAHRRTHAEINAVPRLTEGQCSTFA